MPTENVFSRKKTQAINQTIKTLFDRVIAHHTAPPELTPNDIYHLLVRPEHVTKLREVDEVVGRVQTHRDVGFLMRSSGIQIGLQVSFAEPLHRLIPAYISAGPHKDADPELLAEVQAWVDRRVEIGMAFAKVKELFRVLNWRLSNPAQMKFYFEGIITLMRSSDMEAQAMKLMGGAFPANIPSIAPELRALGIEATKTLSRFLLLPEEIPPASPVSFLVAENSVGLFNVHIGGTEPKPLRIW